MMDMKLDTMLDNKFGTMRDNKFDTMRDIKLDIKLDIEEYICCGCIELLIGSRDGVIYLHTCLLLQLQVNLI